MSYQCWCRIWNAVVFAAAFAWFLLTAAAGPYPGISSDFLSSLCYPGFLPAEMQTPLDALAARAVVLAVGPEHLMQAFSLLSAALGALVCVAVFRASLACVHLAYVEEENIPELSTVRTHSDFRALGTATGLGAALLSAVSLPLWALSTRPQPHLLTLLLTMLLLAFSLGLRWRCAKDLALMQWPTLRRKMLMGLIFGFAVFLGTTAPTLLPVSALAVVLSGAVLVSPDTMGRGTYTPWIVGGVLGGLVLSVVSVAGWHAVFTPSVPGSPIRLWTNWMLAAVPQLKALVFTMEGAVPLVCFSVGAVLILECIPIAFVHRFRPVIGQLVIAALVAAVLLRWPPELWDSQTEPSALSAVAILLIHMSAALLVGSWERPKLDRLAGCPKRRVYGRMLLTMGLVLLPLTAALGWLNRHDGAGRPGSDAVRGRAEAYDAEIPAEATLWLNPPADTFGIPLRRFLAGRPLTPVRDTDDPRGNIRLGSRTLDECAQTDPVLKALMRVGGQAVLDFLQHSPAYRPYVVVGSRCPVRPDVLTETAAAIAASPFGSTAIGRRSTEALKKRAARERIYRAESAVAANRPDDAAKELKLALEADPDNPAVLLNFRALYENGCPVERTLRDRARHILEDSPWLRAPSPEQLRRFENTYGPVHSADFESARRLSVLFTGHRPAVLASLRKDFLTRAPGLSDSERIAVLVTMTEEEAWRALSDRQPAPAELEFFLCAHPWSPRAEELYGKYRNLLEDSDCIALMYGAKTPSARERFTEGKPLSFFLRDSRFAYAWLHVRLLLDKGLYREAAAFVSGFKVIELGTRLPYHTEQLRLQVLRPLTEKDPDYARSLLEFWLRSNPKQFDLWTAYLRLPVPQDRSAPAPELPEAAEAARKYAALRNNPYANPAEVDDARAKAELLERRAAEIRAENEARAAGEERRRDRLRHEAVYRCLRSFPRHPEASVRFGARLRASAGNAAADRYRASLRQTETD